MCIHDAVPVDTNALNKYFELNAIEESERDSELQYLKETQGSNLNTFLRRVTGCYREMLSVPWMLIHIMRCAMRYPDLSIVDIIDRINNHYDDFDFGITCDIMSLSFGDTLTAVHDSIASLPSVGVPTIAHLQDILSADAEILPLSFSIGDSTDYVEKWNVQSDEAIYEMLGNLRCLDYSDDMYYLLAKVLYQSGRVLVSTAYDISLGHTMNQVRSIISIDSVGFNMHSSKALLRYKLFNPDKETYYGGCINDAGEWLPANWEQWSGGLCLYTAIQHLMAISVSYSASMDCEQVLCDECSDRFTWLQETVPTDKIVCDGYTFLRTPEMIFLRTPEEGFIYYTELRELTCTHKLSKQAYDRVVMPVVRDCL